MVLIKGLLGQQRMGFAMPEISWGRPDQFGDFMTVLKLGAVDFNDGARVIEERLCRGLHCARLPRASGAQEQKVSDRSADRREPSEKSLVSPDDLNDCFVLPNDEV